MEEESGQPQPIELFDDAQIIFKMKREGWNVEQLPQYYTIMGNYTRFARRY